MTKEYATPEECAAVTRQATTDENWLANQLDRIDPHRHEIGSAGDRPALERLVFELKAENERLRKNADRMREALTFYAQGEHFHFDRAAWDTVSGEPQNYWCDEEGTATVEDGTIAKLAIDAEMKGTP